MIPLFFATVAPAEERILEYRSRVAIAQDSVMTVREDITVTVEHRNILRGIYRDYPTDYKDAAGRAVRVGFRVTEALLDGASVPWKTEKHGNGTRVYVGDSGSRAPKGKHTYSLTYETTKQLGFFEDHDELYWNVTGNGWAFPIDRVRFSLSLPGDPDTKRLATDFYTGFAGERGKEARVTSEGDIVTTGVLSPGEGLTIFVSWPKGIVRQPSPADTPVETFFRDHAFFLFATVLVCMFLYYPAIWWFRGRDPVMPPFIPIFRAPEGVDPGFMRYVRDMSFDSNALAASVLDLAVKGAITIEEVGYGNEPYGRETAQPGGGFTKGLASVLSVFTGRKFRLVRGSKDAGDTLSPEEQSLLRSLLPTHRNSLILEQENHGILESAISSVKKKYAAKGKPLFAKNIGFWITGFCFLPVSIAALFLGGYEDLALMASVSAVSVSVLFVAAIVLGRAIRNMWSRGTVGGKVKAFIVAAVLGLSGLLAIVIPMALFMEENAPVMLGITAAIVGVFVFKKLLTIRSEEGVRVFAQTEGLRMFIETSERERLQMLNPPEDTPELFETLLPYALALGAARTWANRFADVLERAGYAPSWYSGSMPAGAFNAGFASSFASDFSGSIASSSTAPGSSSGSGGSSGGGGGGGGGGGW